MSGALGNENSKPKLRRLRYRVTSMRILIQAE